MKPRKRAPHAVGAAKDLRAAAGARELHDLDLEALAAACDAFVLYGALEHEEGRKLHAGKVTLIRIREDRRGSARARFTMAHEIGHDAMHRRIDQLARCLEGAAPEGGTHWRLEREADDFASELTLPEALVVEAVGAAHGGGGLTLDSVDGMAARFGMSLEATAIRVAELAPAEVALVRTTAGTIDWAAESHPYRGKIVKRRKVEEGTLAARLAREPGVAGERLVEEVDGRLWGTVGGIVEEAVRTEYGAVLSWLRRVG